MYSAISTWRRNLGDCYLEEGENGNFPFLLYYLVCILAIPSHFLMLLVSVLHLFSKCHDLRPGGITHIGANCHHSSNKKFPS